MVSAIKTFVFMDCETTGLEQWSRITELCMVAMQTDHLLSTSSNALPRVINKLNLCFNPLKGIHPVACEITGLSNEMLEHACSFNDKTLQMLQNFVDCMPQPVCLVAHNGNKFDYPILRNHIKKLQFDEALGNLLSVDFLPLAIAHYDDEMEKIRVRDEENAKIEKYLWGDDDDDEEFLHIAMMVQQQNETTPKGKSHVKQHNNSDLYAQPLTTVNPRTVRKKLNFGKKKPSFKLGVMFERMTGAPALQSHEAEADVMMLVRCASAMGQEFVDRANKMAVPFMQK